jgi:hypothetical protein
MPMKSAGKSERNCSAVLKRMHASADEGKPKERSRNENAYWKRNARH